MAVHVAGALTIAWGIAVWWVLPPDPIRARSFKERERYILVARLRLNNAGVRNIHLEAGQIRELLLDLKFWTVFEIAFLSSIQNGPMSSFIPIIIQGMGFSGLNSLLLKIPSGASGCIMLLILPYLASKFKNMSVWLFALAMSLTILASLLL